MVRKSKWNLTSGPEDNSAVAAFCEGLFRINFKTLTRPAYDDLNGRSAKELRWALRVFSGGSMSFFRDLMKSHLVIRENKLEAVSFLVLRAMYETICGAHYVNEHYTSLVQAGDLEQAWKLLSKFNIGSKALKYHQITPAKTELESPVKIGEMINSLDSLSPGEPKGSSYELYSHLSEFSHPDALAFSHYSQMDTDPYRVSVFSEPEPDQGFLRHTVGTFIMIAGIVYVNLFRSAEFHTAERQMTKFVDQFRAADAKYPKPTLNDANP